MASSQIIILAIIATSAATFISRFMGALTSEKVSVKSRIFQWFNCVAYSTLAALLGRMIVFPAGVLWIRFNYSLISFDRLCWFIFNNKENFSNSNNYLCNFFRCFDRFLNYVKFLHGTDFLVFITLWIVGIID